MEIKSIYSVIGYIVGRHRLPLLTPRPPFGRRHTTSRTDHGHDSINRDSHASKKFISQAALRSPVKSCCVVRLAGLNCLEGIGPAEVTTMAEYPSPPRTPELRQRYHEALGASGLVDDVSDILALDPRPYRFSEGDHVCRNGDRAHCLWVIVDGSVSVSDQGHTLFVRQRHEVVGEQNILGNGCQRWYDLIASECQAELLAIEKCKIDSHPQRDLIWRNRSKIISLKLKSATTKSWSLLRQLDSDTQILHSYMNEYALSRRLQTGGLRVTDYRADRAIIWFSDVVKFSSYIVQGRNQAGTSPSSEDQAPPARSQGRP